MRSAASMAAAAAYYPATASSPDWSVFYRFPGPFRLKE
jgi:hypothetical protein